MHNHIKQCYWTVMYILLWYWSVGQSSCIPHSIHFCLEWKSLVKSNCIMKSGSLLRYHTEGLFISVASAENSSVPTILQVDTHDFSIFICIHQYTRFPCAFRATLVWLIQAGFNFIFIYNCLCASQLFSFHTCVIKNLK